MARPRKPANAWMPRWVELDRHGYRVKRRGYPTARLCGPDASRGEVWAAYERWLEGLDGEQFTVSTLIDLYLASPQYTKELAAQTQKDYLRYSQKVRAVFGALPPDSVTSPMVQMFMDARGEVARTSANRERTLLGILFKWGKARGLVSVEDPTASVRPFKEAQGGRYVEDADYLAFYDWLGERGHRSHQAAMEIAYLCAARQQDILALTRADVTPEGLMIYQQKTGKRQLKLWSERLRDAVDLALSTNRGGSVTSAHVIRNRSGKPYTRTGFNSTWGREQRAAHQAGAISARFRFHDLKVKGVSDYEGDKQEFSGHKTRSMVERYNRTPDRVISLNKARIKAPK